MSRNTCASHLPITSVPAKQEGHVLRVCTKRGTLHRTAAQIRGKLITTSLGLSNDPGPLHHTASLVLVEVAIGVRL